MLYFFFEIVWAFKILLLGIVVLLMFVKYRFMHVLVLVIICNHIYFCGQTIVFKSLRFELSFSLRK